MIRVERQFVPRCAGISFRNRKVGSIVPEERFGAMFEHGECRLRSYSDDLGLRGLLRVIER